MSHRLPVNGNRCLSNSDTRCRRKIRPEIVNLVTTSVTTLFHNRHDKYRKYTESRLRSTTDQPTYVPSTCGQRRSMPLKHWQPQMLKNLTRNSNHRDNKRHNTFALPHAKYSNRLRKSGSFDDRSAIVCPIGFTSTTVDAS
jgi:hypothetical protein